MLSPKPRPRPRTRQRPFGGIANLDAVEPEHARRIARAALRGAVVNRGPWWLADLGDAMRHYLKDSWCRHEQNNALFRGGRVIERDQRLADARSGVAAAAAEVYELTGGMGFNINLKATMGLASEVAGGFAGGTLQRRLLKELARRTKDGKAAQDWWRDLRKAFDIPAEPSRTPAQPCHPRA